MARQPRPAWVDSRALLERSGQHLIIRPRSGEDTPWEFPGGRCRPAESPEAALRRLCREQLDIEVELLVGQPPFEHGFGTHTVRYRFYQCAISSGEPAARGVAEIRWVTTQQLRDYIFDPVMQQVADWLVERGPG